MKIEIPLKQKIRMLIGGSELVAIFLILFGSYLSYEDLREFTFETIYLEYNTAVGKGKVIDSFATNMDINDVPVFAYDYVFDSPIGDLEWTSYSFGRRYSTGAEIEVEYNLDNPEYNRIKGMHNYPTVVYLILFSIPLLLGIVWLSMNLVAGLRTLSILNNGIMTEARLIHKVAVGRYDHENNLQKYKMTFEYYAKDRKSYRLEHEEYHTERLEDEFTEKVIYHKDFPQKAFMVDGLSKDVAKMIKNSWAGKGPTVGSA
ncbi:hypothetical protein FUAX_01520 [Fulvitalea axinellae]|uniref:DUF3592 domain-containing protein n=1 Tax=Fulvitalea axinellae TaxID=1182444 RepID=A0AAU9DA22_9BACT|nr:hypothetical protein FUAX_01520 [Fulvitalea axinellae]